MLIDVTRKPRPPDPAPFVCVICEKTIRDDFWSHRRSENRPPICGLCVAHWGQSMRPSGVTRGDYQNLRRLKAINERFKWEIHNGKRAKRSLTFG